MRVNFIVEDFGAFKYLGCATAANNLYKNVSDKIEVSWNSKSTDFDLSHFHTFGPQSMLYARKFKGKKIITAHSTPKLNYGNLAFPGLINLIYKPVYKRFDHIISVSEKCKRELLEDMKLKKDITTIYNGIDTKKFIPNVKKRKKFREKNNIDGKLVLTVAQRTPRKGIYDFLRLAKKMPDIKFLWVGGFPYGVFSSQYMKIKKEIDNRSKNTLFPGFVEDIKEVYSAADIFFMPSYAEGHSIVMLEALSMGLPMIARDNEEFREAFGENLLYFTEVEKIKKDFFSVGTLRKYKSKTKVVSNFDISRMSKEHVELYEKLTRR